MNKALILLSVLLLNACTTVYKVDEKGVCRDPKGKVVPIPTKLHPFWSIMQGGGGSGGPDAQYRWMVYQMRCMTGTTAFGWR